MNKRTTLKWMLGLAVVATLVGGIGLVQKFVTGERLAGYGSYVPWGLWVALYFHGVGIAGGAFAIGVVGYLLGVAGFREHLRVTIWVSAVSLVMGLFSIWLDLGQPWRMYRIFTDPSFTSMMAFNAWMYMFFLTLMAICFVLSVRKDSPTALHDRSGWLVPLLMVGGLIGIAFPSQSGAFFGVVDAKPYWHTAMLPIMFLTSAIAAGGAVLLLVFTFVLPENTPASAPPLAMLRRVTLGAVLFYLGAEFAELSIAYWSPVSAHRDAFNLVLFGPFWWVFWVVHLGGAAVGLALLSRQGSLPVVGTGAFVVALTFVSSRLNILIPGQAVEQLKGLREAFMHPRLEHYYEATQNEYLVALFIGGISVLLVAVGIKLIRQLVDSREATVP
ncbi:MAG: polysulfide reductase NrfD [Verrucomicrobiae bacterium]|nr:polysulfide reductase NrfD [Verrucomicrobiae bacterium]MDW8344436.1 NrfD/PsrC family molybdoenzyme membrane anchor subunit [Verrucomicrobiae bacterium]